MEVVGEQNPAQVQDAAKDAGTTEKKDENMFSTENLAKDTAVPAPEVESAHDPTIKIGAEMPQVTITPEDKVSFLDAIMSNTRFTKSYSLYGGRVRIRLRSLTLDETNAIAAFLFKQSVNDATWHLSGRGRRYALAAQVEMFNGTELAPLEAPLFETLAEDGKTTKPPAWVDRDRFWDNKDVGLVEAILKCMTDFDTRYKILISKAQDENFWNPDTP